MRSKLILFALIGSFFCAQDLIAKELPVTRVAANNAKAVKENIGKTATVHGKVKSASVSKSGIHFLNFYSSNVVVVCFKQDAKKFDSGGPAKLWNNKEIEVTGKLENYKGKPQIKITQPTQVRLASATKRPGATGKKSEDPDAKGGFSLADIKVGSGKTKKKPFELKQTGKLTWLSPAGLIYKGKDAKGLTRVEHVLRHAADQPNRAGSHGVFDGGNDIALAVVDEAWKLAKEKKIKPKKERDRLAYTIPMGRRVGYLGGKSGKSRNHPPLKKVFIVISGKSEVITAFPR